MVEHPQYLDLIFGALSDSTRRDILTRVAVAELSVSAIAEPYALTFAAVSKHLMVLEKAQLITKRRRGKEQLIRLAPKSLDSAAAYLRFYQQLWSERMDSLEEYLRRED